MYELMIETDFSAAHQLRGYKGSCERLHGHNWRVQVFVRSQRLGPLDLAIDFHELKAMTGEFLASIDHAFLNDIPPFTELNPSSENIARWIFEGLREKLSGTNVVPYAVTVWESPTASAKYFEDTR